MTMIKLNKDIQDFVSKQPSKMEEMEKEIKDLKQRNGADEKTGCQQK